MRDTADAFLIERHPGRAVLRSAVRAECSQLTLYPLQFPPTHRSHRLLPLLEYPNSAPSVSAVASAGARVPFDVFVEELLSSGRGEQSPRRFGRVPQDQRSAVGGERPARSFQYVEARRVHELHPREIKDDRLLRTEVGLDRVSQPFTGRNVDLAANMDDRRTVNLRYFSRELLVHDPEGSGAPIVRQPTPATTGDCD